MGETEVVLVTGASRGIGNAIAAAFARRGATVVGTATTAEGAAAVGAAVAVAGGVAGVVAVAASLSAPPRALRSAAWGLLCFLLFLASALAAAAASYAATTRAGRLDAPASNALTWAKARISASRGSSLRDIVLRYRDRLIPDLRLAHPVRGRAKVDVGVQLRNRFRRLCGAWLAMDSDCTANCCLVCKLVSLALSSARSASTKLPNPSFTES